jgi:ABC-type branched-subunit amino acid transport system ATPase component
MPDELLKPAPADSSKVNLHEPFEVEYWTQKLGCSREELEAAVQANGTDAGNVAAYFQPKSSLPIRRIHLENFRSFRDLEIGPFKRVNLIAGLNNAGKTGLLEAIFLALRREGGDQRTQPVKLPHLFRVFSSQTNFNENFWPWLFRDKRSSQDLRITVTFGSGQQDGIVLSEQQHVQKQGHVGLKHVGNLGQFQVRRPKEAPTTLPRPAVFASHPSDPVQDAIDYNRVILRRGKKKVEELLRQIDPRLQSIEALQTGQQPLIYADIGLPEMIPVSHLGEGFCRLLDIYSELLAGEARVLLIDEVENGLHHSVLPIVWKGLLAAAKELDVQIFATTHSAECIFAADQAARQNKPYDLNLIRLDRVDGEIQATMVDADAMETAKEFAWELR